MDENKKPNNQILNLLIPVAIIVVAITVIVVSCNVTKAKRENERVTAGDIVSDINQAIVGAEAPLEVATNVNIADVILQKDV